jgi:phage gp37-like protein
MDELVLFLLWHSHETDSCAGVWGQVIYKVTPHGSAWDDSIGCSDVVADPPVVSVCWLSTSQQTGG